MAYNSAASEKQTVDKDEDEGEGRRNNRRMQEGWGKNEVENIKCKIGECEKFQMITLDDNALRNAHGKFMYADPHGGVYAKGECVIINQNNNNYPHC